MAAREFTAASPTHAAAPTHVAAAYQAAHHPDTKMAVDIPPTAIGFLKGKSLALRHVEHAHGDGD